MTLPLMALLFLPLLLGPGHALPVGRPPRRSQASAILRHKAAVPERRLLPRPRGDLLRPLDRPGAPDPNRGSMRAGPDRGPVADAADPGARARPGWSLYFLSGDVRRDRLDDVARARLVLVDLRRDAHDRAWALERLAAMVIVASLLARRPAAVRPGHAGRVQRPGQPAAGVHDALGLHVVLAVPDHLERQPDGGDPLVPPALGRRLAVRRAGADRSSTSSCRSSAC